MLSQCCLQRQHSDKISVFDLFQRPKTFISSQKKGEKQFFCPNVVSMLSQCCLQRQHSDNIFKKLFFLWKILDMFATPAQSCLNVVSRDNIQTTLRQHNICKKKLLWTILDMFATRSQSCLNVVSRDNIQTTFREHSNNIGTKHFLKNLGHVCNSQPMLLDGPVQINFLALTNCVVDLYVPPKPTCILMQTPNIGPGETLHNKLFLRRNIWSHVPIAEAVPILSEVWLTVV